MACIVPGIFVDTPKNDELDAAWRSLKALGHKHIGPKIGNIQMKKAEFLQQVYTRGAWSRTPDHHLVFTYQAMPRHSTGRKRMKHGRLSFSGRHSVQPLAGAGDPRGEHAKGEPKDPRRHL